MEWLIQTLQRNIGMGQSEPAKQTLAALWVNVRFSLSASGGFRLLLFWSLKKETFTLFCVFFIGIGKSYNQKYCKTFLFVHMMKSLDQELLVSCFTSYTTMKCVIFTMKTFSQDLSRRSSGRMRVSCHLYHWSGLYWALCMSPVLHTRTE